VFVEIRPGVASEHRMRWGIMRLPAEVLENASTAQRVAAECPDSLVRLVAGPGSGKSRVIRDRVLWLVGQGVPPQAISVVSFTRASSGDLERDVLAAWTAAGLEQPCAVRVGTLHALALRILRAAGQLNAFPVSPRVLDEWEMDAIFDAEFSVVGAQGSSVRRRDIRLDHEAFWSTGAWLPPGLPAPVPAITADERAGFEAYYRSRSSLYCYLLPSGITRRCLEYLQAMPIESGLPVPMDHLIVDEYQDLNPVDLALIREIQQRGVHLYASGDDDQSIYFFRYAMPAGIQRFDEDYPGSTTHVLQHCFRCPDEVLAPSLALMNAYAPDTRIPKDYIAVPSLADPPVVGNVGRWYFRGWRREADAVAASCRSLIDGGMPAEEIAILISSRPALERVIVESLEAAAVLYELSDYGRFADGPAGRVVSALVRLVVDTEDYVAVRTLIGVQTGIGAGTCNNIAAWVLSSGLRYGDVLSWPDLGVLNRRARRAIEVASGAAQYVQPLQPADILEVATERIAQAVDAVLGADAVAAWNDYAADLPAGTTLEEVSRLLASATPRAERTVLNGARARLGLSLDDGDDSCVRVVTLHGSKGLTFEVVFIPALEQGLLPSQRDAPYPGLVQQAARVLFVGMTRARLLVVLSMAAYRMVQGNNESRQPTPFVGSLSGRFEARDFGLSAEEVAAVMAARDARVME
jgi:DNA helicase II / ATP-dependent DNA helicase PcrA